MPYERKGKCIYNKETGEKKGCSTTVGKAKAYMRALYAAEKGSIKEESSKMTQAILDRAEDIYQAMKATSGRKAIKRYGADAEDVLRGRAMNIAKKQVKMSNKEKLKEIIKKKLSTPPAKKTDKSVTEIEIKEGFLKKLGAPAAILAGLLLIGRINSSDSEIQRLKAEYEKATTESEKDSIQKEITKRLVFLDTGQEDIKEKKGKDLDKDGDVDSDDYLMARDIAIKKAMKEEVDYEGEMAKSELYRIIENAEELFSLLDDDTQLEGWVQSKITKAADYLTSVTQYLKYQYAKQGPTDERLDYTLDK